METKPRVVVSRCIEFDHCRWNAQIISSETVKKLKPFVEFIPVCAEVEIGLGTPRQAIRLAAIDGETRLITSMEGEDITQRMQDFCQSYVPGEQPVHGFILKSRSPSCGMNNVKVYPGAGKISVLHARGVGLFADAMMRRYPHAVFEDEGRLTNLRIREHFLTALFVNQRFSELPRRMAALVAYHSDNKYLFMSYNQAVLHSLGKVVANHDKLPIDEVFMHYRELLTRLLVRLPRLGSWLNSLMHMFGYVSARLDAGERGFFMQLCQQYREQQVPLIALTKMLHAWALRFDEPYLLRQTLLQPYPQQLQDIHDSGKGRDF
jgi:uncharacterized protein YbgA (DUF1722 family)/uncharacterized protein YbbK (DUF523 family)